MSTWMNKDNLYIRYGQGEVTPQKGGVFGTVTNGGTHVLETEIALTTLSTSTQTIIAEGNYVPKGYILERVEIINRVAATSGGDATLNVGFIRNSDRTTEIDHDGAVAAAALATFNAAGETVTITQGSTGAGALVGIVTSADHVGLLVASAGTAVFTAGVVVVRLYLRKA